MFGAFSCLPGGPSWLVHPGRLFNITFFNVTSPVFSTVHMVGGIRAGCFLTDISLRNYTIFVSEYYVIYSPIFSGAMREQNVPTWKRLLYIPQDLLP